VARLRLEGKENFLQILIVFRLELFEFSKLGRWLFEHFLKRKKNKSKLQFIMITFMYLEFKAFLSY
jgi:hypothetical protein